jgi:hypothetical protein
MMSTAPPFLLTREQAVRLQGYLQTYRQVCAHQAPALD